MPLTVPHFYQWFPVHLFSIFKWLNIRLLCGTVSRFLANSYHMSTEDLALKAVFCILMSPNKGESTVHGFHCPSDMVVRMRTAELVVCASCWNLVFLKMILVCLILTEVRQFTQTRRRRHWGRQKSNRFHKQNNNSARASCLLVHFLTFTARLQRTWNDLILRFMEEVNLRHWIRIRFLKVHLQKNWPRGAGLTQWCGQLPSTSVALDRFPDLLCLLVRYSSPRGVSSGTPVSPLIKKSSFDLIWFL